MFLFYLFIYFAVIFVYFWVVVASLYIKLGDDYDEDLELEEEARSHSYRKNRGQQMMEDAYAMDFDQPDIEDTSIRAAAVQHHHAQLVAHQQKQRRKSSGSDHHKRDSIKNKHKQQVQPQQHSIEVLDPNEIEIKF